jgi:O-antigen/teichoic acid export membrane protein
MKVEHRLVGNIAVLGAGEFVAQFANFFFVILIARAFGPGLLGQYSLAMAISALAVVFVSFGTTTLLVRDIGRAAEEGAELLRVLFPVQVVIAMVAWIIIVLGGAMTDMSGSELGVLAAVSGYQILFRLSGILLTEPKGRQQMNPVAIVRAGIPLVILCAAAMLVSLEAGPLATLSVMPVAALFFTVYAGRSATRLGGPIRVRWDRQGFLDGLLQARSFFMIMLLGSAYERIGVIILGVMATHVTVGHFAAGERMMTVLAVLVGIYASAALPALSNLAARDSRRLLQLADHLVRLAWLVGLPSATVLMLFSDEIIALFFGAAFSESAKVLAVASLLLIIRAILSILGPLSMATGRPGDLAYARGVALVVLCICAPTLIWLFGARGLAGAMVVAEFILVTVLASRLAAAGNLPRLFRPGLGVFAACSVTFAAGWWGMDWPLLVRAFATVAVGITGLWVFGAIRARDIQFLLELARTKRQSSDEQQ